MKIMEILFTSALFFSMNAFAQKESLCLDRPITFAHYDFGILHTEGEGGIDDDILAELERRTGCKFKISFEPRARIWKSLESGTLDMAGSGVQTPARDQFAWFSHYVVEDNQVTVGADVPESVKSMEAFLANPKLKFGGVRSYSYSPYYDKAVQQLIEEKRFYEVNNPKSAYEMFRKNRFDAFISSQFLLFYYIKKLKLEMPTRIEDWSSQEGPTPSGLVISKKSFTEKQGKGWQELIEKMIADGTVKKIAIKHMGEKMGAASVYSPAK